MTVPAEFDRLTLVLLRRPPDATDYPEDELERIQREHLAYLATLRERGVLAAAGPFDDQRDESLRGLCIFRTSVDEARALTARDPAVQAGRLAPEAFTWWFARGEVRLCES